MIPNILSIAGSDPSGGAGIQADLKAISANGGYAMAALTALTAQNTRGVTGVHAPPPGFLTAQIDAVFADIRVDAVKIGMLGGAEAISATAGALARWRARNIVLDPVMIATSGDRLLPQDAEAALAERLLPLAALVTPNLPEAAALTGEPEPTDRAGITRIGRALLARGAQAALIKGGHLGGGDSPDLLLWPEGELWLEGARLPARETHGAGCTLSAALAARLGAGDALPDAARTAKTYIAAAITAAPRLDAGGGAMPLDHFFMLRGPK